MKSIQVFARILSDEGKPAAGHQVTFQLYTLSPARWVSVGRAQTDNAGNIDTLLRLSTEVSGAAPVLRMVESGAPSPRVLADGAMVSYNAASQLLRVDFGTIERLEETAYTLQASTSVFARTKYTVAGGPQRGEIPQTIMVRAMSGLNPAAVGRVADAGAVRERAGDALRVVDTERLENARMSAEASRLKVELARVTARESTLQSQFDKQRTLLQEREGELRDLREKVQVGEQRLEAAKRENETFRERLASTAPAISLDDSVLKAELGRFTAREIELQTQIEKHQVSLHQRNIQIGELRSNLQVAEQKLAAVESENAAMRQQVSGQQPLQEVAASIGDQLYKVNESTQVPRGYRLTRVQLDLKGTISKDGSISMPTAADLSDKKVADALQNIRLELAPESAPESGNTVAVPDVQGLTESAARRVLHSVGLRLESVIQAVPAGHEIPIGQSFLQAPAAGSTLARGGSVLVTFAGKALELE